MFLREGMRQDRKLIKARYRTIRKLRTSELLKTLPKLELGDHRVSEWVRSSNIAAVEDTNRFFLMDQIPLPTDAGATTAPSREQQRKALKDWLLSQAPEEQVKLVIEQSLRHDTLMADTGS